MKCIPLPIVEGNHPNDRSLVIQLFRFLQVVFSNNIIESKGTNLSHQNPYQSEQINAVNSLKHFRLLCSQALQQCMSKKKKTQDLVLCSSFAIFPARKLILYWIPFWSKEISSSERKTCATQKHLLQAVQITVVCLYSSYAVVASLQTFHPQIFS